MHHTSDAVGICFAQFAVTAALVLFGATPSQVSCAEIPPFFQPLCAISLLEHLLELLLRLVVAAAVAVVVVAAAVAVAVASFSSCSPSSECLTRWSRCRCSTVTCLRSRSSTRDASVLLFDGIVIFCWRAICRILIR